MNKFKVKKFQKDILYDIINEDCKKHNIRIINIESVNQDEICTKIEIIFEHENKLYRLRYNWNVHTNTVFFDTGGEVESVSLPQHKTISE